MVAFILATAVFTSLKTATAVSGVGSRNGTCAALFSAKRFVVSACNANRLDWIAGQFGLFYGIVRLGCSSIPGLYSAVDLHRTIESRSERIIHIQFKS